MICSWCGGEVKGWGTKNWSGEHFRGNQREVSDAPKGEAKNDFFRAASIQAVARQHLFFAIAVVVNMPRPHPEYLRPSRMSFIPFALTIHPV